MNEQSIDLIEHLEVIEALLKLSTVREKEIFAVTEENAILKRQISSMAHTALAEEPPAVDNKTVRSDKVLIAESSEVVRSKLVKIFKDCGYYFVVEAGDGEKALHKFKQHSPQIVTLDSELGLINGFEVAKAIKNLNPSVTIIIIGNIENKLGLLQAVRSGATDVITKPINYNRLMRVVESVAVGGSDNRVQEPN